MSATENHLVRCFQDAGKDKYRLVNYSDPLDFADSEVEIVFENVTELVVYKNGTCKTVRVEGGRYQTKLTGGEGEFVVPVK